MNKRSQFCGGSVLAVAVALGLTAPAGAQTAASAPSEVDEVVVTGSYIAGTSEQAALPVDVIGADELQKQGNPSPVELMKSLTVSNGVLGDTNQFDARAQGAEGSATINLRGLGPARTLVLWNGRRLANAPTLNGASPDLNVLPFAAVGRIEVLKDGAAATYGSDAIAGVVNFITRRNTDGLEVSGSYKYIDGASGDWDAQAVWGKSFDGGLSVMLTGEYHHKSQLSVRDRSFTQPGYFTSPETGFSSGNSITAFLPVGPGGLVGSPAPFAPVAGLQRDAGCVPLGGIASFSGTTPTCLFNYTPYDNIQEKENRFELYGELNWDINDDTKFHLEGFYSETNTPEWRTSPSYLALQVPTAVTNPAATSGLSAGYFVPASNPGFALYRQQNPTQIPAFATGAYIPGVLYRPLAEGGNPLFGDGSSTGRRKFEAYRVSGGFQGKLGPDIGYDVSATYMREDLTRTGYDALVSRLQLALRGLGGPNCNVGANTPGANGCQYFNPFSNAIQSNYLTGQTNPNYSAAVANDPELIRWFFQETRGDFTSEIFVTDLVFNGELPLEFGGGNVGWAVGGQYRKSWYTADYDSLTDLTVTPCIDTPNAGVTNCSVRNGPFTFLGGGTPADLSGDVWAGFAEVSLPFTDTLQVQAAARYEDYGSKGGSTFNPKVSARWQITDVFAVRGSLGTTFRAPPLTSLDPGQVTSLQFLGGAFRAVDVLGNPALDPEKATTYSIGGIIKAGPFRATIDYFNFNFKNPLVAEPVGGIFNTLFPTGTGVGNCGQAPLAALQARFTFNGACSVANLSRIRTQAVNGPGVKTDGIDILADYDIEEIAGGRGHLGGSLTYVRRYDVDATVVEGVTVAPAFKGVGKLNYQTQIYPIPQWKASVFAEYNRDIHTARITLNYIDSYVDQRTSPFPPNVVRDATNAAVPLTNAGQKIDSQVTVDLTYRATLPWDTTVIATVDNVFDEDPAFARLDLGYDPFTGGALGRTVKVTVNKKF